MKNFPLVALIAVALPVAAHAQDADVSDSYFTGTHLGIAFTNTKSTIHYDDKDINISQLRVKRRSPAVILGYNAQIGDHFILGAEGNFSYFLGKKSRQTISNGDKLAFDPQSSFGGSAHAGVLILPKLMAYGLVGWQQSNADLVSTSAGKDTKVSKKSSGMSYGGGLEYAFSSRSFVRAEYRYDDAKHDDHARAISIGFGLRF